MNDLWAKARCLLLTGIVCFIFAACSDNNDEKNETMTKEQLMREAIRLSEDFDEHFGDADKEIAEMFYRGLR